MSELVQHDPSAALATQMRYAQAVADASMLPDNYRGRPANVLLAVGLGQSMGLSPAESLYRIAVIKGKPTASAELVAANVRKAGHRLRVTIEPGKATCSIWRSDDPEFEFKVVRDVEWAQQMGLAQNDNYKKQGDTMLSWRAITACARLACPEALYGVAYTPDEMYDMDRGQRPPQVDVIPPETSGPDEAPANSGVDAVEPVQTSGPESLLLDVTSPLAKALFASINEAGITEAERLPWISSVVGRDIGSSKELTEDETRTLLRQLDEMKEGAVEAEVVS